MAFSPGLRDNAWNSGRRGLARAYYLWIVIAIVVVVLYFAGGLLSQQSIDIDGCRAEWSTAARRVSSPLCPNATEPCLAQPFAQQHNAIVDALLCACGKAAEGGSYANSELNSRIESVFSEAAGVQLPVREICEQGGGGFMIRWRYG